MAGQVGRRSRKAWLRNGIATDATAKVGSGQQVRFTGGDATCAWQGGDRYGRPPVGSLSFVAARGTDAFRGLCCGACGSSR